MTLVVRDGVSFVPDAHTHLVAGDRVLIVATAAVRAESEQRLRAVSRTGRLARWYGERGDAVFFTGASQSLTQRIGGRTRARRRRH